MDEFQEDRTLSRFVDKLVRSILFLTVRSNTRLSALGKNSPRWEVISSDGGRVPKKRRSLFCCSELDGDCFDGDVLISGGIIPRPDMTLTVLARASFLFAADWLKELVAPSLGDKGLGLARGAGSSLSGIAKLGRDGGALLSLGAGLVGEIWVVLVGGSSPKKCSSLLTFFLAGIYLRRVKPCSFEGLDTSA